jgi:hypothetical protein
MGLHLGMKLDGFVPPAITNSGTPAPRMESMDAGEEEDDGMDEEDGAGEELE